MEFCETHDRDNSATVDSPKCDQCAAGVVFMNNQQQCLVNLDNCYEHDLNSTYENIICSKCNDDYIFDSIQCVSCPETQFSNNSNECVNKIDYCDVHNRDTSTTEKSNCTTCESS